VDAIRAFGLAALLLLVAAMTGVYMETLRNTIDIRALQDFGILYRSAGATEDAGIATATEQAPPDLNPPHFRLFVRPFTWFEPTTAFVIWIALSGAVYAASLAIVARTLALSPSSVVLIAAATYLSPAMHATLLSGQVALLLLLPMTLAWRAARQGRDRSSGAWLGVCASLKPPFLFFAPALAVARHARALAAFLGTLVVLFGVGLGVYGLEAYREWMGRLAGVTWAEHYMNMSVLGLLERSLSVSEWRQRPILDAPALIGPLWVVIALPLASWTLWRLPRLASTDEQLLMIVSAALLVSPVAWVYYAWLLVPPLAGTVADGARSFSRARQISMAAAVAGLVVPLVVPWTALRSSGIGTLTAGSIYGWALLALWIVAATARTASAASVK
jgi:hypothetical protein